MKKKEEEMESPKKEEIAEDWCFVCKEGGLLMVCEYKHCLKAYHPHCVEKSESDLEEGNYWTCNLHICMVCRRSPDVCCLCCPKAVCWQCMKDEQFVHIKEGKGFCSECLRLSLMIEEKVDVDSDGEHVDFYDINTWEGLYKEYWDIVNKQEGLTLETLHAADARLKKGNKKTDSDETKKRKKKKNDKRYGSDLEHHHGCEESEFTSDTDCSDDMVKRKSKRRMRRSTTRTSAVRRNVKRKEFIGWGSKALIEFLQSINVDVTEKLSQANVSLIISRYIKEKNLFHPLKKRKVVADESLQSLFGRTMFNKHKIRDFLDAHFAENQEPLDNESGYDSEDKSDIFPPVKRQRKMSDIISKKEVKYIINQCHYASIVPGNIDLVYLRRSFVQKLLEEEEPDTFDNKVIGSFVKVKSDPNDYIQREPYKLMQVTGTTWNSAVENNKKVLLKVSGLTEDIGINYLSECDITKEECEELKQCVKKGDLEQPTVTELSEKAAILHEGRTKHWIDRELKLLQNRIEQANEKGWRQKLYEHLDKKEKLLASREQLLQNVPAVTPADMAELEFMPEDVKKDISIKYLPAGSNRNASGPREKKRRFYESEEYTNLIMKSKAYEYNPSPCWTNQSATKKVEQGTKRPSEVVESSGVEKDDKKNAATQTD